MERAVVSPALDGLSQRGRHGSVADAKARLILAK